MCKRKTVKSGKKNPSICRIERGRVLHVNQKNNTTESKVQILIQNDEFAQAMPMASQMSMKRRGLLSQLIHKISSENPYVRTAQFYFPLTRKSDANFLLWRTTCASSHVKDLYSRCQGGKLYNTPIKVKIVYNLEPLQPHEFVKLNQSVQEGRSISCQLQTNSKQCIGTQHACYKVCPQIESILLHSSKTTTMTTALPQQQCIAEEQNTASIIAGNQTESELIAQVKKQRTLYLDFETYSSVPIKYGAHRYADPRHARALLVALSADGEHVACYDLRRYPLSSALRQLIEDAKVVKRAHNAPFDHTIATQLLALDTPFSSWECTLALCARAGLPRSLDAAARQLHLTEQKDDAGKDLIQRFCLPQRTKKRGKEYALYKERGDVSPDYQRFANYCVQDVRTTAKLYATLAPMFGNAWEQRNFQAHEAINRRGIRLDRTLITQAATAAEYILKQTKARVERYTGISNVNSVPQVKAYLQAQTGRAFPTLNKEQLNAFLAEEPSDLSPQVHALIHYRLKENAISLRKYSQMTALMDPDDDRLRDAFIYASAFTGRSSSRGVQLQNLPRIQHREIEAMREMVRGSGSSDGNGSSDADLARLEKDLAEQLNVSLIETLSDLLRTTIVPSEGCRFVNCDFSAVEPRVVAWLAGEEWRNKVFRGDGKIYEAGAAQLFNIPMAEVKKDSPERAAAKRGDIAGSYGGGEGALARFMPGEAMRARRERFIQLWREVNPHITRYWHFLQQTMMDVVSSGLSLPLTKGMTMVPVGRDVHIILPSGRRLVYHDVELEPSRYGSKSLSYAVWHTNGAAAGSWKRVRTYGGKLTENVVQAVARDALMEVLQRLDRLKLPVVAHVHDEVLVEVPIADAEDALAGVERVFAEGIPWGKGLVLKGVASVDGFYSK